MQIYLEIINDFPNQKLLFSINMISKNRKKTNSQKVEVLYKRENEKGQYPKF